MRVRQVEGRENFGEGGQDVDLDGAVYRSRKCNVHFGNTEAEPVLFQQEQVERGRIGRVKGVVGFGECEHVVISDLHVGHTSKVPDFGHATGVFGALVRGVQGLPEVAGVNGVIKFKVKQ